MVVDPLSLILVATIILILSSFTCQFAVWSIRKGDRRGFIRNIAVTFVLGLWVGRRENDPERWRRRWLVVGGYLLLTLALFAFFHPVYVAETIPYDQWRWRMWFPSWI